MFGDAEFGFNATYNLHEIDILKRAIGNYTLKRAIGNYTLHRDEDMVKIPLTYGAKESCIVATIHDNPTTLSRTTHIQTNFSKPTAVYIVEGVVISLAILTTIVIVVALCTYRKSIPNSEP